MPSLCSVDIKMTDAGDEYNKFTSNVNGNGIVFLARQYMDAIAIIDPQDIVDILKKVQICTGDLKMKLKSLYNNRCPGKGHLETSTG